MASIRYMENTNNQKPTPEQKQDFKQNIEDTLALYDTQAEDETLSYTEFSNLMEKEFCIASSEGMVTLFDSINGTDAGVEDAGIDRALGNKPGGGKTSTVNARELATFFAFADTRGAEAPMEGKVTQKDIVSTYSLMKQGQGSVTQQDRTVFYDEMDNMVSYERSPDSLLNQLWGDNNELIAGFDSANPSFELPPQPNAAEMTPEAYEKASAEWFEQRRQQPYGTLSQNDAQSRGYERGGQYSSQYSGGVETPPASGAPYQPHVEPSQNYD
jgi:hypothetical protein